MFEFDIKTPEGLSIILENEKLGILKKEADALESRLKANEEGKEVIGTSIERIERGVFYTHTGLVRAALRKKLGNQYSDYQRKLYWSRKKVSQIANAIE